MSSAHENAACRLHNRYDRQTGPSKSELSLSLVLRYCYWSGYVYSDEMRSLQREHGLTYGSRPGILACSESYVARCYAFMDRVKMPRELLDEALLVEIANHAL